VRPFLNEFEFEIFDVVIIKVVGVLCGAVDDVREFVGLQELKILD
jgi:hypothetical protein